MICYKIVKLIMIQKLLVDQMKCINSINKKSLIIYNLVISKKKANLIKKNILNNLFSKKKGINFIYFKMQVWIDSKTNYY